MKIAFDVMGSDYGSKSAILAAIKLIAEFTDVEVVLVGNEVEIKQHLAVIYKNKAFSNRLTIHHAKSVIKMDTALVDAIRNSESSMRIALNLAKNKVVDGVLTSGTTAAYLALCHLLLGEIPGIIRPAFMPVMPTIVKNKRLLLLDVGANIENTPLELVNFALMGHTYSQEILNVDNPKVALVNIGTEANKGPKVLKETYGLLQQLSEKKIINFCGNIEARDIMNGQVDVVVCDGYTGNTILKALEGMGSLIFTIMRKELTKNYFRKFVAFLASPSLKGVKTTFDYKNTGGAQLIGINGICFKAHGSSDVRSYYSTLKLLRTAILQDVTNKIKTKIAKSQQNFNKEETNARW